MSARGAPAWIALRMSLLMKAEQCSPNLSGAARLEGDRADVLGALDAQVARRRLLEEGAGARRAGLVHRVVDRDAVVEQHVLGVLPADLEERVDVGLEVGRAGGVGDDLVVDAVRLQEDAEQLAGRAGGGGERDPRPRVADLLADLDQAALERRHGVAVGPPVVGRGDLQRLGVDRAPPWSSSSRRRRRGCTRPRDAALLGGKGSSAPAPRPRRAARRACRPRAGRARRRRPRGGSGWPSARARCAAPKASKKRACAGTTKSICGQASARKRRRWRFWVTPPTSTTWPARTLALIRNSPTLSAMTFESERAMSPFVASPLFRRWVQSDFMKTEQRAESLRTRAPSVTASRLLEVEVHAAELLAEELARAGGALVARVARLDARPPVEDVDDEVLAAERDDGARAQGEGVERRLHGARGDHVGDVDPPPSGASGREGARRGRAVERERGEGLRRAPSRCRPRARPRRAGPPRPPGRRP